MFPSSEFPYEYGAIASRPIWLDNDLIRGIFGTKKFWKEGVNEILVDSTLLKTTIGWGKIRNVKLRKVEISRGESQKHEKGEREIRKFII